MILVHKIELDVNNYYNNKINQVDINPLIKEGDVEKIIGKECSSIGLLIIYDGYKKDPVLVWEIQEDFKTIFICANGDNVGEIYN